MDFKCVYCQETISNLRIKCRICTNYELCFECFTSGAESGNHKADHDYEPMNDGYGRLFRSSDSSNWRLRDELSLIEGIEQYGLGNWEAVSCRVDNKSAQGVKQHYEQHFVTGSIGCETRVKNRKYKVTDHTGPIEGPLSPTLTAPLPPLNLTKAEAMELGFLPLRDDFEREWDNDAEQVLSGAMVHHTDEDVDVAYKLSLVSMYRLRLRERRLRKKVARDCNLVNVYTSSFKKGQPGAKKRSVRDYKEYQEKMKKFCQFMSFHEHDRFFNSLQKEKQLKSRIKELMKFRRNGITSQEDAETYTRDSAKRERNKDLAKTKKVSSLSAASSPTAAAIESDRPNSPVLATGRSRSQHANPVTNSENTTAITNNSTNHSNNQTDENNTTTSWENHPQNNLLSPDVLCNSKKTPDKKTKNNLIVPKLEPFKDILTEKTHHNLRSPTNGYLHQQQLLSETEKRLCKRIGMKTTSYVTLKTCILKDYLKRQHGTPVKLRFPAGFDKTHRRTILNFLEHSGWIQMEN